MEHCRRASIHIPWKDGRGWADRRMVRDFLKNQNVPNGIKISHGRFAKEEVGGQLVAAQGRLESRWAHLSDRPKAVGAVKHW